MQTPQTSEERPDTVSAIGSSQAAAEADSARCGSTIMIRASVAATTSPALNTTSNLV
jgi:hypothetical protein